MTQLSLPSPGSEFRFLRQGTLGQPPPPNAVHPAPGLDFDEDTRDRLAEEIAPLVKRLLIERVRPPLT